MQIRALAAQTTVCILAGGVGKRFLPLTADRAKPAVPLAGKYRLIDVPLSNCLNSKLGRLLVMTQTMAHSLNQHINRGWAPLFPPESDNFIEVLSPEWRGGEKKWYEGTADCIQQNRFRISQENPRWVLILAGDHLYKMNYLEDLLVRHVETGAQLTIASVPIPIRDAKHFGVLETDANNRVRNFVEKPQGEVESMPSDPNRILGSMGVYVWDTAPMCSILDRCTAIERVEHDFGLHVIPMAIEEGLRVFAYPFVKANGEPEYWEDVGRIKTYHSAHMKLMSPNPEFDLYDPDWSWHTAPRHSPLAKSPFRATLENGAMISDGCIIDQALIDRSVIGPNCRVRDGVVIRNSVIFDNVHFGEGAYIENAIIDKHNRIPAGAIITPECVSGFELPPDFIPPEDGVIVIPKKTTVWNGWEPTPNSL
ncbi:MAG: sugar phosphate nucleotidyltransferase [Candidatus Berkelbacteria bacterium]|nr:sugar phosphate nucleotidyltransferase [Candidatus Berkelbacteria bacterium]